MWVAEGQLPRSSGHPFYSALDSVLSEAGFDRFVEDLCEPHYAKKQGRPSIPPGVYFRMLFVGYFEGLDSQRGIAWRCQDSLSIRDFLGLEPTERSPDHSSMTVIRKRLPFEVFEGVFRFVLRCCEDHGLLEGKTVAVDSTFLEANAAMSSIVRRETGEDWKEYIRRLAEEDGVESPSDEDARRWDRKRGGKKKVSNDDWVSKTDPDSRIMKMKDGRTHLAYKAEHAIDLDTDVVLAASIYYGDHADYESLAVTLDDAQDHLDAVGSERKVEEVVGDKGYHSTDTLLACEKEEIRSYIPERQDRQKRRWTDKPQEAKEAFYRNRRRVRGPRNPALQRKRSEYAERSFAHTCETGRGRRSHLRGLYDVGKRWLGQLAGRNLGVLMREWTGVGTPRSLQAQGGVRRGLRAALAVIAHRLLGELWILIARSQRAFSTGC
ncbi:MAG: transposase [Proteobacteria bacterium]|nr:transposase [Pseudomonadota bacterium]